MPVTFPYPVGPAIPVAGSTVSIVSDRFRDQVEPLGEPGAARRITASTTSASVALTPTVTRVSIVAVNAPIRFVISTGTPTATATSHLILATERLDLKVPTGSRVAAIREGAVDGTLEIMELM